VFPIKATLSIYAAFKNTQSSVTTISLLTLGSGLTVQWFVCRSPLLFDRSKWDQPTIDRGKTACSWL
jgi:hypothetical protein